MSNNQVSPETGQVYSAPPRGPLLPPATVDAVNTQTRLDVTEQIRRFHELYGGSDNTDQKGLAARKSLNYAKGPTLQQATRVRVGSIEYTIKFLGQIGLFGAENNYARVQLDVTQAVAGSDPDVDDYEPAVITYVNIPIENTYVQAEIQFDEDLETVNTYEPARLTNIIPPMNNPKVSVRVDNLKTGNIYIDSWLDVQLYTKHGEMWPYDIIYLSPKDYFYIGFHARNTRRLDYNVDCIIGEQYVPAAEVADQAMVAGLYS